MTPEEIKTILSQGFDNAEVLVEGDGSHFQVTVISNQFDGLRPVKRQQMVYSLVNDQITSGALHAIGIKTYTEEEWQTAKKFQVS